MNKSTTLIVVFCLSVLGICSLAMGETEIASAVVGGLCGILVPKQKE